MLYSPGARTKKEEATATPSNKLINAVVVVIVLYFAQEVFIPIAVAVLLSFLLAPLVVRLRRTGLGRIPSVILCVLAAMLVVTVVAWGISSQLVRLVDQIPRYQQNIHNKLQSLDAPEGGVLDKVQDLLDELSEEFAVLNEQEAEEAEAVADPAVLRPDQRVLVEVYEPEPSPLEVVQSFLAPLLTPLAQAGLVLVFVVFMLLQREDLRDRFIRLTGGANLNVATQAMDDAARRVSRYLLMQLVVNATYGIPVGLGLYFLGVPGSVLWGMLATLLRFIPYVGPWIAAIMPIGLAFAVDPGWWTLILTVSMFVVLELISNNIIEPWLYGSSTGISPVAILVAAVFWTWLWGPIGLLLSTPLTVCLLVIGKYVPQLEFLPILLGDEPVLAPEARYYQRMLALDAESPVELAEEYLREHTLEELYDEVVLPALVLAEQDRHKGNLDEKRQAFILEHTRDLIDTLADGSITPSKKPKKEAEEEQAPREKEATVLCIAARDEADEVAGLMLAALLDQEGIPTNVVPASMLAGERIEEVARQEVRVVCISALPPFAVIHARVLCKRLRARYPDLKIIVGIWNRSTQTQKLRERLKQAAPDNLATTLGQGVDQVQQALALFVDG